MHSLFVSIFVLFWLAMALIVGGSIATTFTIAAREYEPPDLQRRPNVALQASEVLDRGGLGALEGSGCRRTRMRSATATCTSSGPTGATFWAGPARGCARAGWNPSTAIATPPGRATTGRSRAAPQIVAADGTLYTVLFAPRRPSIFGALSLPAISLTILRIALVVSAITSWWLARAFERADPPHPGGRPRACLGEPRRPGQRGTRGPQGRAGGAGARLRRHGRPAARQSQRHHAAAARHLARAALAAGAHARRPRAGAPAAGGLRRGSWTVWSARSSGSTR